MDKITVKRNTCGDTRVSDGIPTIAEFEYSNRLHQEDVKKLVKAFTDAVNAQARNHDWTKTEEPYKSMFYRDFCDTMNGHLKFEDGEWAHIHYDKLERHHLLRHVPDDVNLIDVIEMLCDCVCAGMARSNDCYEVTIPEDVLVKASANTYKLLKEHVEVVETKSAD